MPPFRSKEFNNISLNNRYVTYRDNAISAKDNYYANTAQEPVRFFKPFFFSWFRTLLFLSKKEYHIRTYEDIYNEYWQNIISYFYDNDICEKGSFRIINTKNDQPKFGKGLLKMKFDRTQTEGSSFETHTGGVGFTWNEVMYPLIGETLERYSSSHFFTKDLHLTQKKELITAFTGKDEHLLWVLANPIRKRGEDLFTVVVKDIGSKKKMNIPAGMVFWNYHQNKIEEDIQYQPTTNGCGGGFTEIDAVYSGLCEVIERDAFLVHWLNGLAPDRVIVTEENRELFKLVKVLSRYKIIPHFLDTTLDSSVPSCLVVLDLLDENNLVTKRVLSGAAGHDIETSFMKATLEALTMSMYEVNFPTDDLVEELLSKEYKPFHDARIGREMRMYLYCHEKTVSKLDFLLTSKKTKEIKREPATEKKVLLERSVAHLNTLGYNVYVYEFNNIHLQKFDYKVVRVIIPGFIPLYLKEQFGYTDHPRLHLFNVVFRNILPHPFP